MIALFLIQINYISMKLNFPLSYVFYFLCNLTKSQEFNVPVDLVIQLFEFK